MRINKFVAQATGLSRRAADSAITEGRVELNGELPSAGAQVIDGDIVTLDHRRLELKTVHRTIMLNKPVGYVCSRNGQGSQTIYDLLPAELHHLKPAGRLDKDSSGLLLLTDDGALALQLTHPRYQKQKQYKIQLDRALNQADLHRLNSGITLDDGVSRLTVTVLKNQTNTYLIAMSEGRNRQIRRTFSALGYEVQLLHRTSFGEYTLNNLAPGNYIDATFDTSLGR